MATSTQTASTDHPKAKRVRTVFMNSMVAHIWAQQTQEYGQNGKKSIWFAGTTIYSYRISHPLAIFTDKVVDGQKIVMTNGRKCSPTTSQHLGLVENSLRGLEVVTIEVPDLNTWLAAWNRLQDATRYRNGPDGDGESVKACYEAAVADMAAEHEKVRRSLIERIGSYERTAQRVRLAGREPAEWLPDSVRDSRQTWTAYAKAFRVGTKLPESCADILDKEAAKKAKKNLDEKVDRALKYVSKIDRKNPIASVLPEKLWSPPKVEDFSDWDASRALNQIRDAECVLKSHKYWLAKGGVKLSDTRKRTLKTLASQLQDTTATFQQLRVDRAKHDERARTIQMIIDIRHILDGTLTSNKVPYASELHTIMNAGKLGHIYIADMVTDFVRRIEEHVETSTEFGDVSDVVGWLWRQASLAYATHERTRAGVKPDWYFRPQHKMFATVEEAQDAWLRGECVPSIHRWTEPNTLVRRRQTVSEDILETSRGASVPFAQAVAIFVKATKCRAVGQSWEANGERLTAGHFEAREISPLGNLKIGCHLIGYDAMVRCAVAEVPHLVKAPFPVPAVIQAAA